MPTDLYTKYRDAYTAGKNAKHKGWERLSPYYNKPKLDEYFYKGFDNEPFEVQQAVEQEQQEKNNEM